MVSEFTTTLPDASTSASGGASPHGLGVLARDADEVAVGHLYGEIPAEDLVMKPMAPSGMVVS